MSTPTSTRTNEPGFTSPTARTRSARLWICRASEPGASSCDARRVVEPVDMGRAA
ncbi:MAG: hypothetical protein NTU45_03925 [Planctomycetota bacterium]|nr:hypothetical protein [Planctomycetota bacterium]